MQKVFNSQIELTIDIEEPRWLTAIPDIENVAENVKLAVFEYVCANADIDVLSADKPLHVSLCLSDDMHVHQLNRDFRGMDKPTNVLSFANIDFADFDADACVFNEVELGDIIIAYETMEREAVTENISLNNHFCHLLAHGILHILGFDHIKDDEAEYMESFEIAILNNLGIANPYADNI